MMALAASSVLDLLTAVGVTAFSILLGALMTLWTTRASHRQLLDHRLRVEKEYELYCSIWGKLFDLRRAVAQLVDPLAAAVDDQPEEALRKAFNSYQDVILKSEPFVVPSVYDPARKASTLVREIHGNLRRIDRIEQRRNGRIPTEQDDKMANEQVRLDEASEAKLDEIGRLLDEVAQAIRQRISP